MAYEAGTLPTHALLAVWLQVLEKGLAGLQDDTLGRLDVPVSDVAVAADFSPLSGKVRLAFRFDSCRKRSEIRWSGTLCATPFYSGSVSLVCEACYYNHAIEQGVFLKGRGTQKGGC